MTAFKPFVRITILSIILTFLLIFLGVKYHWGDHFRAKPPVTIELNIPDKRDSKKNNNEVVRIDLNSFDPDIVQGSSSSSLIDSMNKEQITEHCINFFSKELKDPLTLELATVNCVVSNFQETFQNQNVQDKQFEVEAKTKNLLLKQECAREYIQNTKYTTIEKQLMIGVCVSDRSNSI